jgi:hypothetical protein
MKTTLTLLTALLLAPQLAGVPPAADAPSPSGGSEHSPTNQVTSPSRETSKARNSAFELSVTVEDGGRLRARLSEPPTAAVWADGSYHWSLQVRHPDGVLDCRQLQGGTVRQEKDALALHARFGGLTLEQRWRLPADQPWMEETVRLKNDGDTPVSVMGLECGFLRRIADVVGRVEKGCADERLMAIPFRKRPTDPANWVNDHGLKDLLALAGREPRCDAQQRFGFLPSRHWCSEAWAWTRGERALALMSFCQERMVLSTVSSVTQPDGLALRFGGVYLQDPDGLPVVTLAPGEAAEFGLMRYQSVAGGYAAAAYAYRALLDAQGCRFPAGFNPPVHWNELYDNPEWWIVAPGEMPKGSRIATRNAVYTRADMEREADKARAYHCEALYLDPGWDTTFASFRWDEARLGKATDFVKAMRERYGLAVSLHTPLATWMSNGHWGLRHNTLDYWPKAARRMLADGTVPTDPAALAQVCLGSRQYLDEAAKRLLALCEAGVVFLMFDGNWWNGGCQDPDHRHPVPYAREDHIRANVELARRIHAKFPNVLIEMHDMLCGGAHPRMTPVYYKYGLPGSYDTNWGFELMWNPIEDLRNGRARSLYYYNLACNVPVYLHIDLRDDNPHCTFFWWFASTCRHLGIGGTHANPGIAAAQREAMRRYRQLDALYKHGDFYGISEEIHVHVLPGENRLVVDIFNLSDTERRVEGSMPVSQLGIALDRYYRRSERWAGMSGGRLTVGCTLPPWGHQQVELQNIGEHGK